MKEEAVLNHLMSDLSHSSLDKKARLQEAGICLYPYHFVVTHSPAEIRQQFQQLLETQEMVTVASRVMSQRLSGKGLAFLDLASTAEQIRQNAKIQVMVRRDQVDHESWLIIKNLSLGDWIGTQGVCQFTRTGEPTILALKLIMLSKTIRPIPIPKIFKNADGQVREAYTVQDINTLWRYPEIDMLVRRKAEVMVARSRILNAVRSTLLNDYQCIELETPYLNNFFGGAEATPFTTFVRALNQDAFLAISPEIELKRAVVGGIGTGGVLGRGVFSIARNFRNEGVDRTHNPEFTSVEVYIPFVDYNFMMEVTERIFAQACLVVNNSMQCICDGIVMDFSKPWPKLEMTRLITLNSGIDVETLSDKAIRDEIQIRRLHLPFTLDNIERTSEEKELAELIRVLESTGISRLYPDLGNMDLDKLRTIVLRHKLHKGINLNQEWDFLVLDLFDIFCEPSLLEPCHVIHHPAKSTVLCKEYRYGPLPNGYPIIERFESFALGMEISNAYSELNDPFIQRQLVEEQASQRAQGREDAMPKNEPFLRAIEMGMPPCGGLGIGIDRMVMMLTNSSTIRDVISFPMVGRDV